MGLPPTTPPKLTDRRIKMDAQARRRERRAEKQAQWKAANPLLVGVSAKPVNSTPIIMKDSDIEMVIITGMIM